MTRLGWELRQTRLGKVHLLARYGLKTVCGIPLASDHLSDLAPEPWKGWDKCKRCLHSLETGALGLEIKV